MAQRLLHLVLRAAAVFFGGTITAHFLASNGRLAGSDSVPDSYLSWLIELAQPDGDIVSAVGNTMVLASFGLLIGGIVGAGVGVLVRPRLAGRPIRAAAVPVLALAGLPGVVLAIRLLDRWSPDLLAEPIDLGAVDGFPWWPIVAAGAIVGLSTAPAFTVMTSSDSTADMAGIDAIMASSASRTEPLLRWRFGLPTTSFLFSLTAMELFGTRSGALHQFAAAVADDDLAAAMQIVAIMVAAAALIAVLVDLVADRFDRRDGPADASPLALRETEVSWTITPLVLAIALTLAVAGLGLLASWPSATLEPNLEPNLGGPLLGTDTAGFDLLPALAAAIGPALLSAAAPAALAVALGWLLASIQWRIDPMASRILGAFIDVLWWPLPLVLAIAHLYLGRPADPATDAPTIALTGLALTPLAARAIARNLIDRGTPVGLRLVATWLWVAGAGLGLSMVLGAMGLAGRAPTLGGLIATATTAPDGAWVPALAPPLVGLWLVGLFIGLGSALTRPAPALEPAPAALPGRTDAVVEPAAETITIEQAEQPVPERELSMAAAGVDRSGATVSLESDSSDATIVLGRARTDGEPAPLAEPSPNDEPADAAGSDEPPPDDNHFLVITQPIDRTDLGLEAAASPESESEPEPEPEAESVLESDPEPVIEPEPEPESKSVLEADPESVLGPDPEPESEPVLESDPEPEPESVLESSSEPEPEPVIAADSEPESESVLESDPESVIAAATGGYQGARSWFRARDDAPTGRDDPDDGSDITIF